MDPRVSPGSPYSRFFGHTPGKEYSRNNVLFLKAGHCGPSHSLGQTSTPWPGQSAPHEWLFPQCACTGARRFPRHAVGSQKFWPFPGHVSSLKTSTIKDPMSVVCAPRIPRCGLYLLCHFWLDFCIRSHPAQRPTPNFSEGRQFCPDPSRQF